MRYLDKKFSVHMGASREYVDNWARTFGKTEESQGVMQTDGTACIDHAMSDEVANTPTSTPGVGVGGCGGGGGSPSTPGERGSYHYAEPPWTDADLREFEQRQLESIRRQVRHAESLVPGECQLIPPDAPARSSKAKAKKRRSKI